MEWEELAKAYAEEAEAFRGDVEKAYNLLISLTPHSYSNGINHLNNSLDIHEENVRLLRVQEPSETINLKSLPRIDSSNFKANKQGHIHEKHFKWLYN